MAGDDDGNDDVHVREDGNEHDGPLTLNPKH